jgi:cytochrome d ubiquinol oxidase subunit I
VDAVLLARIQFAITIGFHFIFAPLGIGLSWLVVWIMSKYRQTGDELYRRQGRFWINLLALSFTVGVATGVTMEFQFGSNWASYSRFVGDIFGAPLAAETIFAFFLESVFLGVLIFGWERLSRTGMFLSALLVAVGSTLSAFWILVANSWMQTPTNFVLRHGRAELTDFWGAMLNQSTVPRFLHTTDAALITGAFFMMGISAWYLLRKRHVEMFRITFTLALVVACITSVMELPFGHYHAIQVTYTQPEKLAAFEGLFQTGPHARMLLFGIPDLQHNRMRYEIAIPSGLSLLVSGNPNTVVSGLDKFPRADWPPIYLTFIPFHLMIYLGMFFIAFSGLGVLLLWMKKLHTNRFYLTAAFFVIPLPFIANELGWMTAEVGRQPWIVYHVLRTKDAVSTTVPAYEILISILVFSAIYLLLFVAWISVMSRLMRRGPEAPADTEVTS